MQLRKSQRGMTAIGWIFVLVLIGFAALIAMKLFPVYMESFKIDSALEGLVHESEIAKKTPQEIRLLFIRRMNIEDVNRFNDHNIRNFMTIKKENGKTTITLQYQAKAALFSNLSVIADWNKQVTN